MRILPQKIFLAACATTLIVAGAWYLLGQNPSLPVPVQPTPIEPSPITPTSTHVDLIRVSTPVPGQIVENPLVVEGEARGMWYFEASFPVKIVDANGKVLGVTPAQAQAEWMTKEFVPFKAELSFVTSTTETGELVLEKDNPSGLPEHADQIRIPVLFDMSNVKSQAVKLYYYNPSKDKDQQGNVACSEQGLEEVERRILMTKTPIADTIRLLLEGNVTAQEKSKGITTEFPLSGVKLKSAVVRNGVLTLTFDDPDNTTSGGACRVNILRTQIETTAKQFSGVTSVRLMPEELFQP